MKIKLFFIILLIFTISCKKDSKTLQKQHTKTEIKFKENGNHCFTSILENKIPKGEGFIIEQDVLSVLLTIKNDSVVGTYGFAPYKENVTKGFLKGTITDNIITSIYTFHKNDIELKEELVFKIEKDKISLLGGEKVKKDGVSVFKDKANGIYMMEIPRINCD